MIYTSYRYYNMLYHNINKLHTMILTILIHHDINIDTHHSIHILHTIHILDTLHTHITLHYKIKKLASEWDIYTDSTS